MSFFVRGKESNRNINKKSGVKTNRKRKITKPKRDQEVSSSDDELSTENVLPDVSSEDETETAQDKSLRLAKLYLHEIKRQEKRKREEAGDLDNEVEGQEINKRLREDYLRVAGKLRSTVAHKYVEADADSFKILKSKFHKRSVTCTCLTSDGKFIFSGTKGGSIVKWSVDEGKAVGSVPFVKQNLDTRIQGHTKAITGIAVSYDAKFLAVGDLTKDIQIWNPQNLEHLHTLSGHRDSVTDLVFRRESHTLYSCSKDRSVKVWSLDEMAYVETLYGHQCEITAIDALSRERAITSGGRDNSIRIWKIPEESQLIYNGHSGSIDVLKLINEENFVSGGDDGRLCIWGVNKKKPLCVVEQAHGLDITNAQPYWISAVASLINTDLIASGSQDGFIRMWKLGESYRSCEVLFKIPVIGFVNSLVFTPDGLYLIAGIGTEHKFGKWSTVKSAKNSVVIIPLKKGSN